MIIKGGRAGSVAFWSSHLLRADTNEKAQVKEFRGVVADDLRGALREMQAVASASRCDENFMYQANLNPRDHEKLTPEQWAQAIDRLEKNLGFEGHARVVVEHVKEGRQHHHVIWSRVDAELRVVSPWQNYRTHENTARELEREFGLELVPAPERRGQPFELWEQQKAEQTKIDPQIMKAELSELWKHADTGKAFAAALAARGYTLAQGDRRDFCVIDHAGTVHSLARRLDGVKVADVRARMADIDREGLPTVDEARASQRERFPDPAGAWANRSPVREREPETGIPAPQREEPDEQQRSARHGDNWQPGWTDSAGMAAQQRSALEWAKSFREEPEPSAPMTARERLRLHEGAQKEGGKGARDIVRKAGEIDRTTDREGGRER